MASSINVSALPNYVEQHKDELFVKATLGAKTLEFIEIMPNVKYKDALNYLDSTVVLADGSACGWNPEGTDVFSQRTIEVKPIKIEKEFCWKDFRTKYANYQLLFEAGREKLPFEEKIADSNLARIKDAVEELVWQGNSGLSIEGLYAQATGETDSVKVTLATGNTATDDVEAVVNAIPARALNKGVNIFMAPSAFRKYVSEQNASCCANRAIIDAAVETLKYVGDSRIMIVPVNGLEVSGHTYMVAAPADALVYGTDIEGSENVYRMWYDEKSDMMDFRVLFNAGTAIKFPDEVVVATR